MSAHSLMPKLSMNCSALLSPCCAAAAFCSSVTGTTSTPAAGSHTSRTRPSRTCRDTGYNMNRQDGLMIQSTRLVLAAAVTPCVTVYHTARCDLATWLHSLDIAHWNMLKSGMCETPCHSHLLSIASTVSGCHNMWEGVVSVHSI